MAREQLNRVSEPYRWQAFADRDALASTLAQKIGGLLENAIAARGEALIAVSGGTTPAKLFEVLSATAIAWDKVTITLVDERFVPPSSPRSNAALVSANLLKNHAAAARFVPLFRSGESLDQAADDGEATLAALALPFDVLILGMGADGHTASFFPDAEHLDTLLDPASKRLVLPVHAASAGEPRLTLSLAEIIRSGFVALHIEGAEKKQVFDSAMGPGKKKPIRRVIDALPQPIEVFWAP